MEIKQQEDDEIARELRRIVKKREVWLRLQAELAERRAIDGACDCKDDPVKAKGTGKGTTVRDTPACVDTRLR